MMKKTHFFLAATLACAVYSTIATAGIKPSPPQFLGGRHYLLFNAGMLLNTTSFTGISTSGVGASSGFTFSLGYGYWFADDWSLNFSAGLFSADATVNLQGASSSMVMPILFGLRYYPSFLTLGEIGRPFIGASAGSYLLFNAGVGTSGIGAGSQAVLGGQATAGVDLFIAE